VVAVVKKCVDCEFFRPSFYIGPTRVRPALCAHSFVVSRVHGSPVVSCDDLRHEHAMRVEIQVGRLGVPLCGRDGAWFEPRKPEQLAEDKALNDLRVEIVEKEIAALEESAERLRRWTAGPEIVINDEPEPTPKKPRRWWPW
jgi:hypothetical protein